MVEEKKVEVTNSNGDWSDEYKEENTKNDSKYFSDKVQEGELIFSTKFTFKSEGEKKTNKWNNESIVFLIEHEGKEKTLEISGSNFDVLHTIAKNKPLLNKTVQWQRQGLGQKDTRRAIKF